MYCLWLLWVLEIFLFKKMWPCSLQVDSLNRLKIFLKCPVMHPKMASYRNFFWSSNSPPSVQIHSREYQLDKNGVETYLPLGVLNFENFSDQSPAILQPRGQTTCEEKFFPEGSNKASWISGQETSVFQAPENPPSVQSHVTTGQLGDKEVEPLLPFKNLSCKEILHTPLLLICQEKNKLLTNSQNFLRYRSRLSRVAKPQKFLSTTWFTVDCWTAKYVLKIFPYLAREKNKFFQPPSFDKNEPISAWKKEFDSAIYVSWAFITYSIFIHIYLIATVMPGW